VATRVSADSTKNKLLPAVVEKDPPLSHHIYPSTLSLTTLTISELSTMTAEQRKAVIKNADMSESMQQDAVDCASQALAKYNIEKVRKIQLSF
jgi:uncharacterized coiled-coil protein SlyX